LTTTLIILGFILALAGLAGCIIPVLPGPPLGFLALLILSYAKEWEPFSAGFLVAMGALTLFATAADYFLPALGAKQYGASRLSLRISIVGMFIGAFLIPPWGMFLGSFLGAIAGELLAGKKGYALLRAGWGVFLGNLLGMGLKLSLSAAMLFFYIRELF
jgi:uncharacterized protein